MWLALRCTEGLASEEERPVAGFLKSCADIERAGWPCDQHGLLVEGGSLFEAEIRLFGEHQQAVLFTHPSYLRCVLASGFAN